MSQLKSLTKDVIFQLKLVKYYTTDFWHINCSGIPTITEKLTTIDQLNDMECLFDKDTSLGAYCYSVFKSIDDALNYHLSLSLLHISSDIDRTKLRIKKFNAFQQRFSKAYINNENQLQKLEKNKKDMNLDSIKNNFNVKYLPPYIDTELIFPINSNIYVLINSYNNVDIFDDKIDAVKVYQTDSLLKFSYSSKNTHFTGDQNHELGKDEIKSNNGAHQIFLNRKFASIARNNIIDTFNDNNKKEIID